MMRTLFAGLTALLCLASAVQADERRMFIIANDADGYGIDRCLANGDKCGSAAANAYCKTREFASAATYHKVEREEITGSLPTASACTGAGCEHFVAIVCTR